MMPVVSGLKLDLTLQIYEDATGSRSGVVKFQTAEGCSGFALVAHCFSSAGLYF
jgi:hypothetical protein